MAKMTTEFDTETKAFAAFIDGKPVPNVVGAEAYQGYDGPEKFRCSFVTHATDEKSGITEMRRLYAAESEQAGASGGAPSADYPGFVELVERPESEAQKDIANFFAAE